MPPDTSTAPPVRLLACSSPSGTSHARPPDTIERDLACLRSALEGIERFGWGSFNVARNDAVQRLATLDLPAC